MNRNFGKSIDVNFYSTMKSFYNTNNNQKIYPTSNNMNLSICNRTITPTKNCRNNYVSYSPMYQRQQQPSPISNQSFIRNINKSPNVTNYSNPKQNQLNSGFFSKKVLEPYLFERTPENNNSLFFDIIFTFFNFNFFKENIIMKSFTIIVILIIIVKLLIITMFWLKCLKIVKERIILSIKIKVLLN